MTPKSVYKVNTYVGLVVDSGNLEVCNCACMPSGRDLRTGVCGWECVEGLGDRTNRLKTPGRTHFQYWLRNWWCYVGNSRICIQSCSAPSDDGQSHSRM